MILTGPEIAKQVKKGYITIDPFDPANIGPNSYDVHLGAKLKVYVLPYVGHEVPRLDMKQPPETREIEILPTGLLLVPGVLYLGRTVETACSQRYVPTLEGRSSVGRLGISLHVTAGFGDVGWGFEQHRPSDEGWLSRMLLPPMLLPMRPTWTLEISVIHPVIIYPYVKIGQVIFTKPIGKLKLYKGKYSRQREAEASRLHEDFKR